MSHSLVNLFGIMQVYDVLKVIECEHVEGDVVEMGCWKGGLGAYMAKIIKDSSTPTRRVWLFDSFEGLSKPVKEMPSEVEKINRRIHDYKEGKWSFSPDDVVSICSRLKVSDIVVVVKGWFADTVPLQKNTIGKISLLRIDCNTYESTKYCLDELFDLVAPGGFIILDDYYNHVGFRKAVYEFFVERGIYPTISYSPSGELGRGMFRKIPDEEKLRPVNVRLKNCTQRS